MVEGVSQRYKMTCPLPCQSCHPVTKLRGLPLIIFGQKTIKTMLYKHIMNCSTVSDIFASGMKSSKLLPQADVTSTLIWGSKTLCQMCRWTSLWLHQPQHCFNADKHFNVVLQSEVSCLTPSCRILSLVACYTRSHFRPATLAHALPVLVVRWLTQLPKKTKGASGASSVRPFQTPHLPFLWMNTTAGTWQPELHGWTSSIV